MSEHPVSAEKAHFVEVTGGAHGWVHNCVVCGYRGSEEPALQCPGPPEGEQVLAKVAALVEAWADPAWRGHDAAAPFVRALREAGVASPPACDGCLTAPGAVCEHDPGCRTGVVTPPGNTAGGGIE